MLKYRTQEYDHERNGENNLETKEGKNCISIKYILLEDIEKKGARKISSYWKLYIKKGNLNGEGEENKKKKTMAYVHKHVEKFIYVAKRFSS